jgi:hypothetical protein
MRTKSCLLLALAVTASVAAQTRVDLQTQGKNADFSAAPAVRPFPTGSALPATCRPGDMYYLLTSAAGQNLYGCTATNVWSLEGDGQSSGGTSSSGASGFSQLQDFRVQWVSGSSLTVGSGCSSTNPCNVRIGSSVWRFEAPLTVGIVAGSGTLYVYIDNAGTLTAGHTMMVTCSAGCSAVYGILGFPTDSIPLFSWAASNGQWVQSGGTDQRAALNNRVVSAGPGIVATDSGRQIQFQVDPAAVARWRTVTASLTFGSIAGGSCAAEQTITLTGAVAGGTVAPGWPSLATGLLGTMRVSAANTIAVRLCNLSGSSVTPGTAQYNVSTWQSF